MSNDRNTGSTGRDNADASTQSRPEREQVKPELYEVYQWLSDRLCYRAEEARHEKDRDFRGVRTILGWLTTDNYTFEQKIRTLITAIPRIGVTRHEAVGEQLQRLLWRCKVILGEGQDPAADNPFTCVIPSPRGDDESVNAGKRSFQSLLECSTDHDGSSSEMERRFEMTSNAIRGVAGWIKEGVF